MPRALPEMPTFCRHAAPPRSGGPQAFLREAASGDIFSADRCRSNRSNKKFETFIPENVHNGRRLRRPLQRTAGIEAIPHIRRLLPSDASRLAAHLKRLDGAVRRLRFGATLTDQSVDAFVHRIDWLRSLHFGHVEDGEVRAACQLAWRDPLWPSSAELAVSVESPRQDHGIGSELMRRTLVTARNRNIRHVTMICLAENVKMRHIARKFESLLELADGDVAGRIDLDHPDHLSMLQELLAESRTAFDMLADGWGAASAAH